MDSWKILELVLDAVLCGFGAFLMLQVKRIDELSRKSPTREEMEAKISKATEDTREDVENRFNTLQRSIDDAKDETVRTRQELRDDMREHRTESREMLGRIFRRLDKQADSGSGD